MFDNISAIRENTDKILERLDALVHDASPSWSRRAHPPSVLAP
jgi:hypothetical protein